MQGYFSGRHGDGQDLPPRRVASSHPLGGETRVAAYFHAELRRSNPTRLSPPLIAQSHVRRNRTSLAFISASVRGRLRPPTAARTGLGPIAAAMRQTASRIMNPETHWAACYCSRRFRTGLPAPLPATPSAISALARTRAACGRRSAGFSFVEGLSHAALHLMHCTAD